MKHYYYSFWLSAILMLACQLLSAHDFEVGGIYYKYLSQEAKNIAVSFKGERYNSYYYEYSGDVVIPETVSYNGTDYSVTSIDDNAFYGCTGVTSIEIPNSVTSVGHSAFFGTSLTNIEIPSSVISIGAYAFSYCEGLSSINVAPNNSIYDSRNNCNAIVETSTNTLIVGCKNTIIPNNVTSIGDCAFYGCKDLTSIDIPNSVTSICRQAFSSCFNLMSFKIPNSVTGIGWGAFSDCTSLTSIEIPNSVTSIGSEAFSGCPNLQYKRYDNALYLGNLENPFVVLIKPQDINVDACVISDNCKLIYGGAFYKCKGLTNIAIPNSVTNIGSGAFSECTGLTSIVLPTSLTSTGVAAFSGCTGLTSIEIPNSVTSIDGSAFRNCIGLTSVVIPNCVTNISSYAFRGCTGLTSLEIPNSVTSIGLEAFFGCTGTVSVNCDIDDTENSDAGWFSGSHFSEVIFGEAVNKVGKYAFYGNKSMEKLTVGANVNCINALAFDKCTGLKNVYCNAVNPPICQDDAFYFIAQWNCTLWVPKESINDYESANEWKDFYSIKENPNYSSLKSITTKDDQNAPLYDLQGNQVVAPRPNGLYIRNGKKVMMK